MAKPPLTPEQRSLHARLAAHEMHSRHDSREVTANARAASPGSDTYWENQVDPDRVLDDAERRRRAEHAKKAHFTRLSLASSRARSGRK